MLRYPHRLVITRPAPVEAPAGGGSGAGGAVDDGGGFGGGYDAPTPSEPGAVLTVLDTRADVQDVGEATPRRATGLPMLNTQATAFLADERKVMDVEPGDHAVVTWNPGAADERTSDAEVLFARLHDGTVMLRFAEDA
jgi:hypothetical protein